MSPSAGPRSLRLEPLEDRLVLSAFSDAALEAVLARASTPATDFYVYRDADSGDNHGFPSGKFPNDKALTDALIVDPAAIDDPSSPSGVTTSASALDRARGTVLRVTFPSLAVGQFVGEAIEEPEFYSTRPVGRGYDLTGATAVTFEARSPTPGGLRVFVGVGGRTTDLSNPILIGPTFQTFTVPLASLRDPNTNAPSPPDLSDVHVLFSVSTNDVSAPSGGTILLDNVRFTPTPPNAVPSLSLPQSVDTFGVVPATSTPFPLDQVLPNLATVYEASLAGMALLRSGTSRDLAAARRIADSFV